MVQIVCYVSTVHINNKIIIIIIIIVNNSEGGRRGAHTKKKLQSSIYQSAVYLSVYQSISLAVSVGLVHIRGTFDFDFERSSIQDYNYTCRAMNNNVNQATPLGASIIVGIVAIDWGPIGYVCVCVCVFTKLHITAQPGPVILVILCHSH